MSVDVSVITPCYKMKNYIEYFLKNLPKQTFFNRMEVILDHNEPEKKEIELVKRFQKKYPGKLKYIIVKKVDPLPISMNRCIYNSKGKFLTIWNVDDMRTDNSIELQYNKIKNNKIDFVYGNYTIVKEFGSETGKFIDHKKFDRSELTKSMILGPYFMFKKSLCNKIGYFDEQFKVAADFDFAIRLGLFAKGTMITQNLGYYLNAQKGLSTKLNSIQPIEKDVICMRYGIFGKVETKSLPDFMNYNLRCLLYNKKLIPIEKLCKNYQFYIKKRILDFKQIKKKSLWKIL
jgi:glycosyltransferase involved in cell wall biosynthesis